MALPGDDLVPAPMVQTTHAATINAPPQRVWPWLVQTGQGRAGFYSDSRFWDRSVTEPGSSSSSTCFTSPGSDR